MITKQIVDNKTIKEVESNLSELENTIRESLIGATFIKQIFTTSMDSLGMSMHSVNKIDIDTFNIDYFKGSLVINGNNHSFSMAINENCNIVIQRQQPNMKCNIFFRDFEMSLIIN